MVVAVMASGWRRRTFNNGRVSLPARTVARLSFSLSDPLHPRLEPLQRSPLPPPRRTYVSTPSPRAPPPPVSRSPWAALALAASPFSSTPGSVPPTPLLPWSSNTPDYGRLRAERFSLEQAVQPSSPGERKRWRR